MVVNEPSSEVSLFAFTCSMKTKLALIGLITVVMVIVSFFFLPKKQESLNTNNVTPTEFSADFNPTASFGK